MVLVLRKIHLFLEGVLGYM